MVAEHLVDPRDLVSSYEIAQRLGAAIDVIARWADGDGGMPAAVHAIGEGQIRLWYWPDVERWARRRRLGAAADAAADVHAVAAEELLTGRQVAARLEWKDPNTPRKMWRAGNGFPAPVKRFGRVWVWRWGDVDHWARTTRRRPGRRNTAGQ